MIHDKDYLLRQVQSFSEFLSKLLLGKNEGTPTEEKLVIETSIKNVFKIAREEVNQMTLEEQIAWTKDLDLNKQIAFYELLGHLNYFQFKENGANAYKEKARKFYQLWLEKSQIFSLPVNARIQELS